MTFAGAPLSALLPIAGLAAAAIAALYVLKLRRRRVVVPFAALWARVLGERDSSALWQRLRRLLSLLLQLVLLALLSLAIADPRPGRGRAARTVAILVDASASMRALDVAPSRFERARAEARALASGLASSDRALVVRVGAEPQVAGGLESDSSELLRQIDGLECGEAPADLPRALRLAADLLRGQPGPTLVLVGDGAGYQPVLDRAFTDGANRDAGGSANGAVRAARSLAAIDLAGIDLRYVPIGSSSDNLAITAFSVRRYPQNRSAYEVLVELRSYRDRASAARLELRQDGELVDVQRIELAPGARSARFYPNLAGAGARLEARLLPESGARLDPFPTDDVAYALVAPRKRVRVLLVTASNLFLEGALLLDENAAIDKVVPGAYRPALAAGYDAVILDGFTPAEPPPVAALYLDPQGPASPFAIAGTIAAPAVTDAAEQHPVMRWVTLRDLNLARSSVFKLRPGEIALASSARAPILVARELPQKIVALGFDVRRSDLPLRVAFPVLLVNTLEWFAGDEAQLQASYATGRPLRLPVDPAATSATVTDPEGRSATLAVLDGSATFATERIGFHVLRAGAGAVGTARSFAMNLADPAESRIAPEGTLTVGGNALPPPSGFAPGLRRELWGWLALLALALALVEYWTYHRRVTV